MGGLKKIPIKRFNEFRSNWERKQLDNLVMWASGGTPSKQVDLYWNGNIPWISASSMRGIEYNDSTLKISAVGLQNGSKLAPKGSLLLLVRGSMLFNKIPVGIAGRDLAFNQDVKSLTCREPIIPRFLLYWFYASEHKLLSMVVGTGIGAGKLDLNDLKSMDVALPTIEEQQKIAAFLTAVDDKIQQLIKKKALLENYKKGVMQQIFNQEIRFKDENGVDYPEWENKELREVVSFLTDYTANGSFASLKENVKYYNEENYAVLVRTTDLGKAVFKPERFTDKQGYKFLKKTSLYGGELVLANVGSIGKVYRVPYYDKPMTLAPNTYTITFKDDISLDYMYQWMLSEEFVSKLLSMVGSSTLKAINKSNLKDITLNSPSLMEQTKIANFLSAIDVKVSHVDQQLELTKKYKKGLLQQMFV